MNNIRRRIFYSNYSSTKSTLFVSNKYIQNAQTASIYRSYIISDNW